MLSEPCRIQLHSDISMRTKLLVHGCRFQARLSCISAVTNSGANYKRNIVRTFWIHCMFRLYVWQDNTCKQLICRGLNWEWRSSRQIKFVLLYNVQNRQGNFNKCPIFSSCAQFPNLIGTFSPNCFPFFIRFLNSRHSRLFFAFINVCHIMELGIFIKIIATCHIR